MFIKYSRHLIAFKPIYTGEYFFIYLLFSIHKIKKNEKNKDNTPIFFFIHEYEYKLKEKIAKNYTHLWV
jgi:hypothetical protein